MIRSGSFRLSGKMTAIMGVLLHESFITSLVILSDGMVMAATSEDPMHNEFIGTRDELIFNLTGVAQAAELTDEERVELLERVPVPAHVPGGYAEIAL